MIDKVTPEKCTLCGSCVQGCPVQAISIKKKYLDFVYPEINPSLCMHCNKCEKLCPVASGLDESQHALRTPFLAKNRNNDIRKESTSGGAFYALANSILSQGGYVAGAVMDQQFQVHHILSSKTSDIKRMMGSKYANSDMKQVFTEIKEKLLAGGIVLFCGCACQIAGLRSFLTANNLQNFDKVYFMEVICHGVPSQRMLDEYLKVQRKLQKSEIADIRFRDKERGWHSSSVVIHFKNGKKYSEPITVDAFMNGFLSGVTLKEACYDCQFKQYRSGCDFMFGDFWGAEIEVPELDDNLGISAIIANTEKGISLLRQSDIELYSYFVDPIIRYNRNILEATSRNPLRTEFYQYAGKHGYNVAIQKYFWETKGQKLRRRILFFFRKIKHLIQGKETWY